MEPNQPPPKGAVVLFNGRDLSNWHTRDGKPAGWQVEDRVVTVVRGTGDILSNDTFADAYLHLEWMEPDMPEASGQAKGNSGVYLQARYEIQVLDSYGWEVPGLGDCGAIYNMHAPLANACKPALEWQTYDIIFRAARVEARGWVLEPARVTVIQNGVVVQNNVTLYDVTGGAIDHNLGEPGPLLLQDHGDPVKYRNIWMVQLPAKGSEEYGPR
jgi:3-keto-disaccharide hydrolase